MHFKRTVMFACLVMSGTVAQAEGLMQLDDEQLSEVRGQDGVNLNLHGFSLTSKAGSSPLTLTYTMPDPSDPFFQDPSKPVSYIQHGGFSISRSDGADPFADPYQIQIETMDVPSQVRLASVANDPAHPDASLGLPAQMSIIRLLNPKNLGDEQAWHVQYDWKVADGVQVSTPGTGTVHDMGTYLVEGLKFYGGGLDLAPALSFKDSQDVRGTAFGLNINMAITSLALQPRGYSTVDTAPTQMLLSGIRVGRANADMTGVDPDKTKAWTVADVIQQPGIISAVTDSAGKSSLHMGIEWYRGSDTDAVRPESIGAFSVDSVSIKNGAGVVKDLGSMSVGGIQIRYLDINFRNPN